MGPEEIIELVKKYKKKVDAKLIKKAYDFSDQHHKGQKRKSGEPYMVHPYEVAKLLAEYKMDEETIAAALLHDTVEDTPAEIKDVKKQFGTAIADMVEGLTKIDIAEESRIKADAATLRKMLMSSTKDFRLVFVKIMDKLHNLRTVEHLNKERQQRMATMSREVYAPLAMRLGLARVKAELEDLSMKYLEPEVYKELTKKVPETLEKREKKIKKFIKELQKELKKNKIDYIGVKGRSKHLFSIYRKMTDRGKRFEDIYDFIAYRIIVNEVRECYEVLGIIHNRWKPIPNRFKDFIAMPKANMYQSLHLTILGDDGEPIEIQIRTKEMDEVAEEGVSAHFKYKGQATGEMFDKRMQWLKQILEWQKENKDEMKFLHDLKVEFFGEEIFCFTPMGSVIELPVGATALDFAYAVHTQIGDRAQGARINGKFVPLRHELKHGDVVEIITSKNAKPGRGWLKIAKTSKALNKIKKALIQQTNIPFGRILKKKSLQEKVRNRLIIIKGVTNPKYRLAKCCNPLPGDDIIGYETKTGLMKIHKKSCDKIVGLEKGPWKKRKAEWKKRIDSMVTLIAEAKDRVGLGADLLNTVSATGIYMKTVNLRINNNVAECILEMEIDDSNQLRNVIDRIKKIQGIQKVRCEEDEY
jgi:GTP pyrophosphokinase